MCLERGWWHDVNLVVSAIELHKLLPWNDVFAFRIPPQIGSHGRHFRKKKEMFVGIWWRLLGFLAPLLFLVVILFFPDSVRSWRRFHTPSENYATVKIGSSPQECKIYNGCSLRIIEPSKLASFWGPKHPCVIQVQGPFQEGGSMRSPRLSTHQVQPWRVSAGFHHHGWNWEIHRLKWLWKYVVYPINKNWIGRLFIYFFPSSCDSTCF